MNNKGITYFRLNSPYEGDITKNCALDGYEVDNNFFTLEGRDIKCVYVENDEIKIELINGQVIKSGNVFGNFAKDLTFDFDSENGILYVKQNGQVQKIEGFVTEYGVNGGVATDSTLEGKGKPSSPLSVSPVYRPGMYTPVKKIIDLTQDDCGCNCSECSSHTDECLPNPKHLLPGDRFLVHVENSDYGLLYNYEGIKKIACDLIGTNSPWRIPTKDDWDDMLNAVEPCEADRNHTSAASNTWLGRFAGKFLKSKHLWRSEGCINNDNANTCFDYSDEDTCDASDCGRSEGECNPTHCGEYHHCHRHRKCDHRGIDKYGFGITPAGYADDGMLYGYFGERGMFWTATVSRSGASSYAKRFDYNKSNVYQDIVPGTIYLSLRLVKDYDGNNYYQREKILTDTYPTVLMPSVKTGSKVWTSVNIALTNRCYHGIVPNDGQGVTMMKKYFIYEWDGQKFLTNELKEGEVVAVFDAPNNRYCTAYQLINGELIDLELRIVNNVLYIIKPRLDHIEELIIAEENRAKEAEQALGDRITEETEARTAADDTLRNAIEVEAAARAAKDAEHDEKIAELEEKQGDVDEKIAELEEKLVREEAARIEGDEALDTKIETEKADRIAADEELNTKIETETAERIAKDEELVEKINQETADRIAADEALGNRITEEAEARIAGDEALRTAIEEEAAAREEKDTEIEGKLLTEEGTEFDKTNGKLTLKSADGTNDITVQFSFNFGEF